MKGVIKSVIPPPYHSTLLDQAVKRQHALNSSTYIIITGEGGCGKSLFLGEWLTGAKKVFRTPIFMFSIGMHLFILNPVILSYIT